MFDVALNNHHGKPTVAPTRMALLIVTAGLVAGYSGGASSPILGTAPSSAATPAATVAVAALAFCEEPVSAETPRALPHGEPTEVNRLAAVAWPAQSLDVKVRQTCRPRLQGASSSTLEALERSNQPGPRALSDENDSRTPHPRDGPKSPSSGSLSFSVNGSCTSDAGTLSANSGNFTPGGRYEIYAWGPNGSPYPLSGIDHGTVRSDGTIDWAWPCAGNPAGTYASVVADVATGRSTTRVTFDIGAAPPPPPPPATKGFTVFGSHLGGTWARVDPFNGRWFGRQDRPANAAYWYLNGLRVPVDCARPAAAYTVAFVDGRRETWTWWLHVTDGRWMPAAATVELSSDGNPGLNVC